MTDRRRKRLQRKLRGVEGTLECAWLTLDAEDQTQVGEAKEFIAQAKARVRAAQHALIVSLALCAGCHNGGQPPRPPSTLEPKPNASEKHTASQISVFGRAQLLIGIDPQNQGDVPDSNVVPDGSLKKEWSASVHSNAALGGRFTYPRPIGGFTASGQVLAVLYVRRIFCIPSAGFTLENPDAGIKIGIGRFFQPTVNTISPGAFQFSTNWGNLVHATSGAYVAKTHGKLLAQVGAGRPDFALYTEEITASPRGAPIMPFVEGRVAYIDPQYVGELPSGAVSGARRAPLTIGVTGAYGRQRVGVGEKAAVIAIIPDAVDPEIEDLTSWIASVEAVVPYRGFVLAGEWYIGKGANVYIGAVRQRPHVDPMTGEHTALSSRGGWVQLSYVLPGHWTVLALGGLEHITHGLDIGVPVDSPLRISENRLIAASLSKMFEVGMHVGVQLQQQSTHYLGPNDGLMYSVLVESSIDF